MADAGAPAAGRVGEPYRGHGRPDDSRRPRRRNLLRTNGLREWRRAGRGCRCIAGRGAAYPLRDDQTARAIGLGFLLLLSARLSRQARGLALSLALAIALTTNLPGHAAGWGDLSPTALIDWVHVVASSAWTGGIRCLALAVLRDGLAWPPGLLGAPVGRFSALAGWCLLAVVLSGTYHSWVQLVAVSALWATL
jgi:hypothetical protein